MWSPPVLKVSPVQSHHIFVAHFAAAGGSGRSRQGTCAMLALQIDEGMPP